MSAHSYRTFTEKISFIRIKDISFGRWMALMAVKSARLLKSSQIGSDVSTPATFWTKRCTSLQAPINLSSILSNFKLSWRVAMRFFGKIQSGCLTENKDSSTASLTKAIRSHFAHSHVAAILSCEGIWNYSLVLQLAQTILFTSMWTFRCREWKEKISLTILAGLSKAIHHG